MLRKAFYFCFYYSGGVFLCLLLMRCFRKHHCAVVVMYHRVIRPTEDDYLDKGSSVHKPLQDFEAEIRFLSKRFDVITLDQLENALLTKTGLQRPSVVLTFDDGYRDNFDLALPILRKYNAPATVYLATGVIGSNDRLWPDRIEWALLNTRLKQFQLPELFGDENLDISNCEQRTLANRRLSKALKTVENATKLRLIDQLHEVLGVSGADRSELERRMLRWSEVDEMTKHGITFGAHTVTHPILARVSVDDGIAEIRDSRQMIERRIGADVRHFAIPNGAAADFSEPLREYCQSSGFKTVVTTAFGVVSENADPMFLRRAAPSGPIWRFACEFTKLHMFPSRYSTGCERYTGAADNCS